MNSELICIGIGIIVMIITFDILNRYKVSKELKEIRYQINLLNEKYIQYHNEEIQTMNEKYYLLLSYIETHNQSIQRLYEQNNKEK